MVAKVKPGTGMGSIIPCGKVLLPLLLFATGCAGDSPTGLPPEAEVALMETSGPELRLAQAGGPATLKAVGSVEIVWPGGKGMGAPEEEKLAFAEFEAFPAEGDRPARGTFTYRVLNPDLTLHREIVAVVEGAVVDPAVQKAWFVGLVISDTKICDGGSCQDHGDGGCGGGGEHPDGGDCGGGGESPDGGCDGGGESPDGGGCDGGGESPDGGGCDGGGESPDGGCDGGGEHPEGGCSGGGEGGHGGVPGKDPRVGQFIAVKVHDRTTPGALGDGITWKWFAPEDPQVPQVDDLEAWPHLCKKTIIGGNLVVHPVLPNP